MATRYETVEAALNEIKSLWPTVIRSPEIEKRVLGKLQLAFNRGRFHETVTSLLENEPRRPDNIIHAVAKHIGIVHGYENRTERKPSNGTLQEIDWKSHSNSDAAHMFRRICGCVMETGSVARTYSGFEKVLTVDRGELLACYADMLRNPRKYAMSQEQEFGLRRWVQKRQRQLDIESRAHKEAASE